MVQHLIFAKIIHYKLTPKLIVFYYIILFKSELFTNFLVKHRFKDYPHAK